MKDPNLICIGAVMGAFGAKGEVRLKSFCADPADIGSYGTLTSEDGSQSFHLTISRPVKAGYAARIKGVRYKDQADALKGTRLCVARDALPNLPDDEFYHSDLIGLEVLDTGGAKIGQIKAVHNHGAGDMLEITGPGLKGGIMLPFTQQAAPTVDLASRRVIVDPPDGVLPGSDPTE
ncbi:MAG: 16S rRNA processing protein RimM [Rhodobacteraceae bacterium]|nr:16S rRNA processing protein RimM [Paracoccaceae bacterium]